MDAYRKKQRAAEKKKNKAQRTTKRDADLVTAATASASTGATLSATLSVELANLMTLHSKNALDAKQTKRMEQVKKQVKMAQEAELKQQTLEKEEAAAEELNVTSKKAPAAAAIEAMALKKSGYVDPLLSYYYDADFNKYGSNPPGVAGCVYRDVCGKMTRDYLQACLPDATVPFAVQQQQENAIKASFVPPPPMAPPPPPLTSPPAEATKPEPTGECHVKWQRDIRLISPLTLPSLSLQARPRHPPSSASSQSP